MELGRNPSGVGSLYSDDRCWCQRCYCERGPCSAEATLTNRLHHTLTFMADRATTQHAQPPHAPGGSSACKRAEVVEVRRHG